MRNIKHYFLSLSLIAATCASTASLLLLSTAAQAASVSGQGTWETTLEARDLDGNNTTAEAYYDMVLGITWLRDANFAQTVGFDSDGRMTWAVANDWAAGLDFNGISGWRLPDTAPVDGVAYDYNLKRDGSSDRGSNISAPGTVYAGSTGSEMAHMFYNTLGNLALFDTSGNPNQPGYGLTNSGPFDNVNSSNWYWSDTEHTLNEGFAWIFTMASGSQTVYNKTGVDFPAWAVHDGDVGMSVVPIPAAAWLFGSVIIGAAGIVGRRKKRAS